MSELIEIDGTMAEGGGQILRGALALAGATGRPFRVVGARANRPKPGLMRQHLTAIRAVAQVCAAEVEGAALGSTTIEVRPGTVRGGDYVIDIGSAGSVPLVLQALVPPLARAGVVSRVVITGGTHNPMAPPFEFLA